MRNNLIKFLGLRTTFTATFERYGKKYYKEHCQTTLLLKDIKNSRGEIICDHIWFQNGKSFCVLGGLKKGDIIQFNAKIRNYVKGYYTDRHLDIRFSNPTNVKKITNDKLNLPLKLF